MIFDFGITQGGGQNVGLLLYGALTAILFIFGVDLLERYFKADKQTRGDPAYMFFFVLGSSITGYGFYMILAILNYYYFQANYFASSLATLLQLAFIMVIMTALAITSETIVFPKKRSMKLGKVQVGLLSFFAIIVVLYIMILFFIDLFDPDGYNSSLPLAFIPIVIAFLIYGLIGFIGMLILLFRRLNPQKETKRLILASVIGLIVVFIGGMVETVNRSQWNLAFIIGTLVEIGGWIITRALLLQVRSYSELEWRSGLVELHVIMAETGISLYYRSFQNINPDELKGDWDVQLKIDEADIPRPNTDLIGGGMIGIKGMLSEIAGTKGTLEKIEIGKKVLIFNQGTAALVLLLADKYLGVYHSILINLVRDIEESHPNLANFNGDTRQLHIAPVVDKYFGPDKNPPKPESFSQDSVKSTEESAGNKLGDE